MNLSQQDIDTKEMTSELYTIPVLSKKTLTELMEKDNDLIGKLEWLEKTFSNYVGIMKRLPRISRLGHYLNYKKKIEREYLPKIRKMLEYLRDRKKLLKVYSEVLNQLEKVKPIIQKYKFDEKDWRFEDTVLKIEEDNKTLSKKRKELMSKIFDLIYLPHQIFNPKYLKEVNERIKKEKEEREAIKKEKREIEKSIEVLTDSATLLPSTLPLGEISNTFKEEKELLERGKDGWEENIGKLPKDIESLRKLKDELEKKYKAKKEESEKWNLKYLKKAIKNYHKKIWENKELRKIAEKYKIGLSKYGIKKKKRFERIRKFLGKLRRNKN